MNRKENTMIEGFKFALTTEEMSGLLAKAISYNEERREWYKRRLADIEDEQDEEEEEDDSAGSNVRRAAASDRSSMLKHEKMARKLTFVRDHLIPDETYVLDYHEVNYRFEEMGIRL